MKKNSEFFEGFKDGIPICLGYFSVSLAFGMSICLSGFPVWLAGLISFTNLTSAGQFAGTSLMVYGAGFLEIALTTLVINLRYFLMSLSLSQKLNGDFNTFRRLSVAHGVTDEIYALVIGRPGEVTPKYMHGVILSPVIGWTAGTVTGGIFSQVLPTSVTSAMNIALYAMFVAIIVPKARDDKRVLIAILIATILSVIFTYVPIFEILSGGWSIIIIAVGVSALMATLFPLKEGEYE